MKPFEKYVKVEEERYLDLLVKEKTYLNLFDENEKLKELCDKYEREHNNEFQCWKKDRKELLVKRKIIEKAIDYMNKRTFEEEVMFEYEVRELYKILEGEENENN